MAERVQSQKEIGSAADLRKEAGVWLRNKREQLGLSQRELANKVGIDYYTFISQIEAGRGKVPSERAEAYAKALDVSPRDFAVQMLRCNDPHLYGMIFDSEAEEESRRDLTALENRLSLLEAKLLAK